MVWSYNLNWGYPLTNEVDRWRYQLKHLSLSQKVSGFLFRKQYMRHIIKVMMLCIVSFYQELSLVKVTAQKMNFSIKDSFSKCDQIHRKLRIWSHLLKKSLMENVFFYKVSFNFIPCVEVKISRKGAHPSSKKVMYKEVTLKCRNTKHSFRQY